MSPMRHHAASQSLPAHPRQPMLSRAAHQPLQNRHKHPPLRLKLSSQSPSSQQLRNHVKRPLPLLPLQRQNQRLKPLPFAHPLQRPQSGHRHKHHKLRLQHQRRHLPHNKQRPPQQLPASPVPRVMQKPMAVGCAMYCAMPQQASKQHRVQTAL